MEYVVVTYPEERPVRIDGEFNGLTNEVLRVDAGTHLFDLGVPADYKPASRSAMVKDTTVLEPLEVAFFRKEQ